MRKHEEPIPFGLLFEEVAPELQGVVIPIYDESKDLSCVQDSQGNWVPLVEFGQFVGTQTETKARRETTDTDPGDDSPRIAATGTRTVTEVRRESTDTNQEDNHGYEPVLKILLGTDTITKVKREHTDRD